MKLPQDYSGAQSDDHLVELWLSGRPKATQRSYRHSVRGFLEGLPTALPEATVADVVAWARSLSGSDSYKARRVIALKSLLTFAHNTGYCLFNVGVALRIPKRKGCLHERIVEPPMIQALIDASVEGRDRILVRFLYATACRVSEAVGVNFSDLGPGLVTFFGKGGHTRTVPIPEDLVEELQSLKMAKDTSKSAVFKSFRGKRLGVRDAQRIVKKARVQVTEKGVSPHWLRHAHATHVLDAGAPLHHLQKQLGHSNISTTSVYLHVRPKTGTAGYLPV